MDQKIWFRYLVDQLMQTQFALQKLLEPFYNSSTQVNFFKRSEPNSVENQVVLLTTINNLEFCLKMWKDIVASIATNSEQLLPSSMEEISQIHRYFQDLGKLLSKVELLDKTLPHRLTITHQDYIMLEHKYYDLGAVKQKPLESGEKEKSEEPTNNIGNDSIGKLLWQFNHLLDLQYFARAWTHLHNLEALIDEGGWSDLDKSQKTQLDELTKRLKKESQARHKEIADQLNAMLKAAEQGKYVDFLNNRYRDLMAQLENVLDRPYFEVLESDYQRQLDALNQRRAADEYYQTVRQRVERLWEEGQVLQQQGGSYEEVVKLLDKALLIALSPNELSVEHEGLERLTREAEFRYRLAKDASTAPIRFINESSELLGYLRQLNTVSPDAVVVQNENDQLIWMPTRQVQAQLRSMAADMANQRYRDEIEDSQAQLRRGATEEVKGRSRALLNHPLREYADAELVEQLQAQHDRAIIYEEIEEPLRRIEGRLDNEDNTMDTFLLYLREIAPLEKAAVGHPQLRNLQDQLQTRLQEMMTSETDLLHKLRTATNPDDKTFYSDQLQKVIARYGKL